MSKHRSTFELDVFHASTVMERESSENVEISEHVASCSKCRAYLDGLDVLVRDGPSLAESAPACRGAKRSASSGSYRGRALASAGAVLALAACIMLYFRSRAAVDDATYVGVKGLPAAQVLVRRNGQVHVWDGVSAVRPGDAIAVSVACEHFTHVTVASEDTSLVRAWEGTCPSGPPSALPFTLVVDSQPGGERFSVVLSRTRLDDDRLKRALRAAARDGEAWTVDFAFAKEER